MERLRELVGRRWFPALVIALGVALQLPSLWMGFWADDYVHQIVLDGELEGRSLGPLSLYDFGTGAEWRADLRGTGGVPWWTESSWKVRFFRPLASLSLALDHALFGRWAPGYHLTGLALYALLLALAFAVYRALALPRGVALLALAIYAATNGAALTVGWPANRNSVVATIAALAAVLVVVRSRARPAGALAAVGLGLLACAGKESGVLALALTSLWIALDARRRGAPLGVRGAAWVALPLAAGAVWVVSLAALGYGTRCTFYATPWADPLRYAAHLGQLGVGALVRLVAPFPIDVVVFEPRLAPVAAGLALALGLPVAVWVARRARGHAAAGMLAAWLLLGLTLQGAAPPSDRLLLDPALGSAGLLAIALAAARTRGERRAPAAVLALALPLSAGFTLLQSAAQTDLVTRIRATVLATDVGPPALGPREAVVLQASAGMVPFVLPATWAFESGDRQVAFDALQMGRRGLELTRTGERTLEVRVGGAPLGTALFETVYRAGPSPPPVGARFPSRLFDVRVLESEPRGARALELVFRRSLDDPALRLLVDGGGPLVRMAPPAVGETLAIPEAPPLAPLLP